VAHRKPLIALDFLVPFSFYGRL